MLTSEYIASQLSTGLVLNFATTDQTIQAAQHNQQQLLAQTTFVDEQYVIQHHPDQATEEELVHELNKALAANEAQVIVTNRVSQS